MRPINPINNNGSIQLKFSVNKIRYSFNPIPGAQFSNKRDLITVQSIATQIQNDILADCFDLSLRKYSRRRDVLPETPVSPVKAITTLELWDRWVKTLHLSEVTLAGDYHYCRSHLEKLKPELTNPDWLLSLKLASSTFNRYLGYMKKCYAWGTRNNFLLSNIYENIRYKSSSSRQVKPFTREEIQSIVTGFNEMYPHYGPFIRFLFSTGVRTSEAIGLRWKDVDFARNTVTISESLPIDKTKNGYKRIRKSTKTGSIRELPINLSLSQIFNELAKNIDKEANQENLIFTSHRGYPIHQDTLRRRYWKPVLEAKDIPYRYPYATRHTFISHAIESGMSLTQVAYIAGHSSTKTIIEHYLKMIDVPELPELF